MAPSATHAVIKDWKRKSFELSYETQDPIISLIASAIDAVENAAQPKNDEKQSRHVHDIIEQQLSLVSMETKTKTNGDKELSLLLPIVIEVVECILLCLKRKNCGGISTRLMKFENELHAFDSGNERFNRNRELSAGLIECFNFLVGNDEKAQTTNDMNDQVFESGEFDSTVVDQFSNLSMGDGSFEEENNNGMPDTQNDSSNNTIEVKNIARPRRNVSKPLKYSGFVKDSDVYSEDEVNMRSMSKSQKKSYKESSESERVDDDNKELMEDSDPESLVDTSEKRTKKKGHDSQKINYKPAKKNDTFLECPECEYRSLCVQGWIAHLKNKHSTNPTLAGLALRCVCGNESQSAGHARTCDIAQFTIIRAREQETPKCILCSNYPKTPRGYTGHLKTHHETTLKKSKIYLKCECGHEIRNEKRTETHGAECDSRSFTLHKLEEE